MKSRFRLTLIVVICVTISSSSFARAEIQAGVTACAKKGERKVENRVTYVCSTAYGSKTKLVWGRLVTPSSGVTKTTNSPSVVVVNSTPKPIPALVPDTNIPWPVPGGIISAYKGIYQEQFAKDLLGLSSLHAQGITGKGYSIAFIDGTILTSHPTFANTEVLCISNSDKGMSPSTCPTLNTPSHGQGVAGTMGGSFGVAPGARLISITGSMVSGLNWVLNNYKKYNITAVSLSIGEGGLRNNLVCGVASPRGFGEVLAALAKEDVAVLFSTANQGTVDWVREPNCLPGVIAVGSVKATDPATISEYSSIGPDIDLLAPADFYSASTDGKNALFGGTSQATPFAAALFALGKQARPDANIAQIFYYIKKTAAPLDDVFVKNIPVVRPVEMVKALKEATELPKITLVKQIQVKSGG
jgi:subtilisin family serine protease